MDAMDKGKHKRQQMLSSGFTELEKIPEFSMENAIGFTAKNTSHWLSVSIHQQRGQEVFWLQLPLEPVEQPTALIKSEYTTQDQVQFKDSGSFVSTKFNQEGLLDLLCTAICLGYNLPQKYNLHPLPICLSIIVFLFTTSDLQAFFIIYQKSPNISFIIDEHFYGAMECIVYNR
ncbi:hypothetical protein NC652_030410 [Populus alba x Populus x berolinensis]|nr:hypothetical protein NC652_030410 [Populus alba x Populus x berolinensis]